jgi:hypothetical protein
VLEPFIDDGLRFQGTIAHVEQISGEHPSVHLQVAGVDAWVPQVARIRNAKGPAALGDLHDGLRVDVRGDFGGDSRFFVVYEMTIRGDGGPAPAVDLRNLRTRRRLVGYLVFPILAAFVGLFVGAADGLLSRALRRSAVCGLVGLGIGLAAGLVASLVAHIVYALGQQFVSSLQDGDGDPTTLSFLVQMIARGLAWSMAGAAMGLGQGVALRSKKLALNGLLGGMVGALFGGLLFDPIDLLVHRNQFGGGGEASRAVGFVVIGAVTGLMIGIVELMARDAWLKMLTGPLAGKEFVLYKNPTLVGSSPKSDIYLFKDAEVEPTHAQIRTSGEGYELEDRGSASGTFVNGRRVGRKRLENGDQIRIGATVLNFTEREV